MLVQKLLMRMGRAIKGIFIGSDNLPPVISTSTQATATAYSNQRRLDRTSNGVLWAVFNSGGASDRYRFMYSTDNGTSWINSGTHVGFGGTSNLSGQVPNSSFFIDQDDYAHFVYKDTYNDGFIYYRRGTPNAERTAWTWSAATAVYSLGTGGDYPDIVAHREGTGWKAHIVYSTSNSSVFRAQIGITATGTISVETTTTLNAALTGHAYASIDFNHIGDGKTVANGTPHLYVAWSAGATGAGKGIRFKKATYNAGVWTWGTEREIDTARYVLNVNFWLNCIFDGTRVVIPGVGYTGSNSDLFLHERDASDTVTTTRTLIASAASSLGIYSASASYDSDGNIHTIGQATASPFQVEHRKWVRSSATLESAITVDSNGLKSQTAYPSVKRGYSGDRIEFIYTDGTASPYSIKYSYVDGPVELYPAQITTSTAATATAYSNQRKIDRTSNGVLWATYPLPSTTSSIAQGFTYYSIDEGITWTSGGTFINGSGTTGTEVYVPNHSFFIDQDDYAHIVFKDRRNGFIYYRRGTPNAARTSWTWSAATAVESGSTAYDYPDVIAHREGTGWVAQVVYSRPINSTQAVEYRKITITSTGAVSVSGTTTLASVYGNTVHKWPSIDFNHTGDGKTVKDGTPHLYVAWSAGATGAGNGIRFKKATYSGGSWTWGTEREIDSTSYIDSTTRWVNCLFDGTRVVIGGMLRESVDFNNLKIFERDLADTVTTIRLDKAESSGDYVLEGSMSYDGNGNLYFFGRGTSGVVHVASVKWERVSGALTRTIIDSSGNNSPYVSAKRGYSNNKIEFIYTDGSGSPYPIMYGAIV